MTDFESSPVVVFMPRIHPDVAPYFLVFIVLFCAAFLYHLRYWVYVRQYLIPPPEAWWIRRRLCALGLHKWGHAYHRIVDDCGETWSQDCKNCGARRSHWNLSKYKRKPGPINA